MSTNLKSFIPRIGGKAWLVADLVRLLPQHRLYCEAFTGGARLFFAKPPSVIEILNDKDKMLINLYKVVQNDTKRQELIKRLQELPYSRSIFNHYRQAEPEDEIEKAVRFFYLSKSSFWLNGIMMPLSEQADDVAGLLASEPNLGFDHDRIDHAPDTAEASLSYDGLETERRQHGRAKHGAVGAGID